MEISEAISQLSMNLSQTKVSQAVDVALIKDVMEMAKVNGDATVEAIEAAAPPLKQGKLSLMI